MKSSRREFLRNAAMVAGSLPVSSHLAALGNGTPSPSAIRKMLAAKRSTIKTLYVDYQYRSSPPGDADFLNGRHQMFFSLGRYHHRIWLASGEGELITVVEGDGVLTAEVAGDVVRRVRVRDRTRRDPDISVGTFLPVPADRPMTPRGLRALAGRECQGILQGEDWYWVDLEMGVVRALDRFGSEEWVKHVTTFEGFSQISEALHFPGLLRLRSLDPGGRTVQETIGEITAVAVNEPLAEELFAIDSFPKPGKRLTLE